MLLFGSDIIKTARLTVPHKQMHLRSFVLGGICEIDANLIHPVLNETMATLAERIGAGNYALDPKAVQLICVAGVIGAGKTTLAIALAEELDCDILKEAYDFLWQFSVYPSMRHFPSPICFVPQ